MKRAGAWGGGGEPGASSGSERALVLIGRLAMEYKVLFSKFMIVNKF